MGARLPIDQLVINSSGSIVKNQRIEEEIETKEELSFTELQPLKDHNLTAQLSTKNPHTPFILFLFLWLHLSIIIT